MVELGNILSSPKSIFRFVLCIACVLGSIGANPALKSTYFSMAETIMIDISIAGGGLVAIALLLCGVEGDEADDNAQLIFDIIYMILTLAGFAIMCIFMPHMSDRSSNTIGVFILLICLIIAFIMWLIDLILVCKKKFC